MGHNVEAGHAGGRVLPTCDKMDADNSSDVLLDKKRRAVTRMKELLRCGIAAKSEKGVNKRWKVLQFRNRSTLKAPSDHMSSPSKMSFTWDMGSCSSAFAVSPLSFSSASHGTATKDMKQQLESIRKETSVRPETEESLIMGNWITTDSEFVVLEL